MPRKAFERGPKWDLIGSQVREARVRQGLSQAALARMLGGLTQTVISRDEGGYGFTDERLQRYCEIFRWDHAKIRAFLDSPEVEPAVVRAQREYHEMLVLLDGKLRDGEEQDLIDEAIQLVIMHRYPELHPKDFTGTVAEDEPGQEPAQRAS